MVTAMVSEFQLEGFSPQRDSRQLVSKADTEDRLPSHQAPNVVHRVGARLGISRAIRQEYSVGFQSEHIFGFGLCGDDRDLAALAAQLAQDVVLDAEVVGDYMKTLRLIFIADDFVGKMRTLTRFPHVGVLRRDYLSKVHAIHL